MRARPSFRLGLLLLALAGLAGIATAAHPAAPELDPAVACAARPGTTLRVSVAVDGRGARSALVHVPTVHRRRMPLILALHGAYGSDAFMERYSGLSRLGDRDGFGVVYPDAAGPRWRIAAGEGGADVQFLDVLLDRVLAGGCFDERRVSAVGVSNGAGMGARLACAGDDRLAGLVAVAGDYGTLPGCRARRPLSVLEIHGTADTVVPYRATKRDPLGEVGRWLGTWVDRDGCAPVPRRTPRGRHVLRLDRRACDGGTAVEHLRLAGGAHAWPGAVPPDPGPRLGISASEEAWEFLSGRRLTPTAAEHDRR